MSMAQGSTVQTAGIAEGTAAPSGRDQILRHIRTLWTAFQNRPLEQQEQGRGYAFTSERKQAILRKFNKFIENVEQPNITDVQFAKKLETLLNGDIFSPGYNRGFLNVAMTVPFYLDAESIRGMMDLLSLVQKTFPNFDWKPILKKKNSDGDTVLNCLIQVLGSDCHSPLPQKIVDLLTAIATTESGANAVRMALSRKSKCGVSVMAELLWLMGRVEGPASTADV
jgi:hypothetical protein